MTMPLYKFEATSRFRFYTLNAIFAVAMFIIASLIGFREAPTAWNTPKFACVNIPHVIHLGHVYSTTLPISDSQAANHSVIVKNEKFDRIDVAVHGNKVRIAGDETGPITVLFYAGPKGAGVTRQYAHHFKWVGRVVK